MAQGFQITNPRMRFFDSDGNPLAFGKLYSYAAGTATPLSIYSDSGLSSTHTNPAILSASGEITIFVPAETLYKFDLFDADDVHQSGWPVDGVEAIPAGAVSSVTPTTLGLVIGTNVQAYSVKLGTFSALTAALGWLHNDGAGGLAWSTPTGDGTFTPPADAAGWLQNNGSGGLSWSTPIPTGACVWSPYSTQPTGFLTCVGAAVSRTTYAALNTLAAADSYPNGSGDGSTTFNVPDLRGRGAYGLAASGTGSTVGGTFGSMDHTHTGPSHTHSVVVTRDGWGSTKNTPSTTGRLAVGDAAGGAEFASSYQPTADVTITSAAGGTGATSAGNAPGLAGYWFIKT